MSTSFFGKIRASMAAHKIWSTVIILVVALGGYRFYKSATTANAEPQYTLSIARMGTLRQTVTGTGQISASNQTDIESQVSGTITSISAKVGQEVTAGQLIATIDSTNAKIALDNAKLSLAKLTEPAKTTDVSNAENNVSKSYNDAFDAAATVYTDLPTIIAGMKDLYYSQGGFLSDAQIGTLNSSALAYRNQAGMKYDAAVSAYTTALAEYNTVVRSSPRPQLDKLFSDTYAMLKSVAEALTLTQTTITYITTNIPTYNARTAPTVATNANTWANTANSDLSSLVTAQNSITTSQNSLTTLQEGADTLDIQTAELNVEQAQRTYDNYFIRAPYDGVIGRIPVNVYGQAGASTIIATIIGDAKIATVSLNEVDAAKVRTGQPVNITFDAIDGLNATGTVAEVDQVGTVSQGVVSYTVKIYVNTTDDRIKPGMSVNVTIITNEEANVLLVPSSAVKKQGQASYVQTFDRTTVMNALSAANGGQTFQFGSTTRTFGGGSARFASSTDGFASSSGGQGNGGGQFGGQFGGQNGGQMRSITINTSATPSQAVVETGDSDDTNTVITGGLDRGTFVITRTVTGSATQTSAPSIFNTLGGRGPGGGANIRVNSGARPGGGG